MWEGLSEEESEKQRLARKLKGKAALKKITSKSEEKGRKQEGKQKKRAAFQPEISKNTFEALGTAEDGENIADHEESDSKQERMIDKYFCPKRF